MRRALTLGLLAGAQQAARLGLMAAASSQQTSVPASSYAREQQLRLSYGYGAFVSPDSNHLIERATTLRAGNAKAPPMSSAKFHHPNRPPVPAAVKIKRSSTPGRCRRVEITPIVQPESDTQLRKEAGSGVQAGAAIHIDPECSSGATLPDALGLETCGGVVASSQPTLKDDVALAEPAGDFGAFARPHAVDADVFFGSSLGGRRRKATGPACGPRWPIGRRRRQQGGLIGYRRFLRTVLGPSSRRRLF